MANVHSANPNTTSWLNAQVARTIRNSLVWNSIGALLLVLLLWMTSDYLYWFFRGPTAASDAEILKMIDQGSQRSIIGYVSSSDRKLQQTNWSEVVTMDDGQKERVHTDTPYFLMPVEDKYLLVQAKESLETNLVGPLSHAREIDQRVMKSLESENPQLAGKILPVVMNAEAAFSVFAYIVIPILVLWGGWLLWNFTLAWQRSANPAYHPIVKQLARYGDADTLAKQIDHEANGETTLRFGKAILTDSWLLRPTAFGAQVVRLADLVWAYHLQQSAESFAVLMTADKKTHALSLKADDAASLIRALPKRQPNAIYGYEKARHLRWRKDPQSVIDEIRAA
jgi:hypothetical protein